MSPNGLNRWLFCQALLWTCFLPLLVWRVDARGFEPWGHAVLAGLILPSFAILWRVLRIEGRPADWATLVRLLGLIVLCCALAFWSPADATLEPSWVIWIGLAAVVLGDLLDGWLARRFGGTPAGAILDMEADQFTLLVLAVTALVAGAGPWPLLVPEIRYLFVLAMRALDIPHHDPKPKDGDNRRGRTICAVVTVLLLAACAPLVPDWGRGALSLAAVVALGYSYSEDVRFLLQRHRSSSS